MEIKKSMLFSCSSENHEKSLLRGSIFDMELGIKNNGLHYVWKDNNRMSLTQVYNQAIDEAVRKDVDCLILVHDDVILEEDPLPKLEKLFDTFDLVGVAGTKHLEIKSPCLWHLMGGGFHSGNLHGKVQHLYKEVDLYGNERLSKPESNFGPIPQRVLMIDGVFMALNRKCMETMRFDETIPCGFHFYDLDFSLSTHQKGLKVGVGDILITHASPGLRSFTPEWIEGDKWFLEKHGN
jgi:hypothetical protein